MKLRFSHLLLPLTLFALAACDDITLTHVDVDEPLPETTVQGIGLSASLPLTLASIPMDVTAQESFDEEDFDYVTGITLDKFTIAITAKSDDPQYDGFEDGNRDNFDFISDLEVSIHARFGGEDRSVVIARLSADDPQIASSARSLRLQTTNIDILDFVEADNGYEVRVQGSGNVPADDVIFTGNAGYRVGIGFR